MLGAPLTRRNMGITPFPTGRQSGRSSGVEHNLAKVGVGRSNRLARSIFPGMMTNAAQGVSDLGHVFRALG